jgi:hypothetical protein
MTYVTFSCIGIPSMLPENVRLRITQLLGMIGSDHDGEVLNAARLVSRTLRHHKMTVAEFLGAVNSSAPTQNGAANRAAWEEGRRAGYQEGYDKAVKLASDAVAAEYTRGFTEGVKSAKSIGLKADRSWREWATDRIDNDREFLTQWEADFFTSFGSAARLTPTVKQYAIFCRVGERLRIALPEHDPHDWGYA